MFRYIFLLILSFGILSSNDKAVKTSELELFLFKVGFESLLKDVEINKDKSSLNEQEIKTINEKIELIMAELYKDKRVLLNDSEKNTNAIENFDKKELENLKNEISFLKKEVSKLKEKNHIKKPIQNSLKQETKNKEKKILKTRKYQNKKRVVVNIANVYENPFSEANILKKLKRNDFVSIESCDKYGWCKIEKESAYIKLFLLK